MTGVQPQGEPDLRGTARSNMFLAAVLEGPGFSGPVKVRNMSSAGALVEAACLPDTGASVHLLRGSLSVSALVAWSAPGRLKNLRASSVEATAR